MIASVTSNVEGPRPQPKARVADAGVDVSADTDSTVDANPEAAVRRLMAQGAAMQEQAQTRLLLQRRQFDEAAQERAEFMREQDALRDMMLAQLKSEDEYLKKWIALI